MSERKLPKVGVGIIIHRNGNVLMGKRKGAHGAGTWSFPGGHLEWQETLHECACREVLEETGMRVTGTQFATATNDIFEAEGKHYVTLYMLADAEGEPQLLEPDSCEGWQWFSWDDLPRPLFICIENLVKQGYRPK